MHIDILAIGSRGDVQPYVALAVGLQSAGHRVRLVTLGGFEELALSRGLDHLSISGSPRDIASSTAGREWIERRGSTAGFLRGFVRVAGPLIEAGIANYWAASGGVDAVVVSPTGLLVGVHVAERLGVPLVRTQLAPRGDWQGRTNLPTTVRSDLEGLSVNLFSLLIWCSLRGRTNAARRAILGLPSLPFTGPFRTADSQSLPVLDAYSEAVIPKPAKWGDSVCVTGYWFLDDPPDWKPPEDLLDFLRSGPAPVLIGFGSTPFPRPDAVELVDRALASAGKRGILLTGGSGLTAASRTDRLWSIDFLPHGWAFGRVDAVVHHGGAGVTGAALRAGLPSVVVPVFADQPFWAKRVFDLGAAARPIPARQLTSDALADALLLTDDREMRRRATALGNRIRAEDGVQRAVDAIHDRLSKKDSRVSPRGESAIEDERMAGHPAGRVR